MTVTTHAHAAPGAGPKAELKRTIPGWNIIRSAAGRWRRQLFPVPGEEFNKPNVVDAGTVAGPRATPAEAAS